MKMQFFAGSFGKTTEADRHPNITTNPNPNPYWWQFDTVVLSFFLYIHPYIANHSCETLHSSVPLLFARNASFSYYVGPKW